MKIYFSALVLSVLLLAGGPLRAQTLTLPANLAAYNVRGYGALGNGTTDDTPAIQAALDADRSVVQDYYGRPKLVYFPTGTYLIRGTLRWQGCALSIQGAGQDATIIKLADNAAGFSDAAAPRPLLQSPAGNMVFHQNLWDLTIDAGRGNPGAIGLDFIANNSGAVRNVRIRSGDGAGVAGLDLTRYGPGPCLFKNLEIIGFDLGIRVGNAEYAPTFERITLSGQRVAGIRNDGNLLTIRTLRSTNEGPALVNVQSYGMVVLLDAILQGGSAANSAIDNQAGQLYLRNVAATGYASALRTGGAAVPGATLAEYVSAPVKQLFPGPTASLALPIEETPEYLDNDLTHWAGLPPGSYYGDNTRWQATLDAGKPVVYFPAGVYLAYERTFTVPVAVRRILGFGSVINGGPQGACTLVVNTGTATDPPLIIEEFGYGVHVVHQSARPVVIRHGSYRYTPGPAAGNLYLEDVEMDPLAVQPGQRVWARQFNSEGPTRHVTNRGGTLWLLGVKTEGKGTVVETTNGGRTEVLGGLLYPVNAFTAADSPAFVSTEASTSLVYGTSSYVANGNYPVQVRETRGGVTRELPLAQLTGRLLPLFTGYPAPAPLAAAPAALETTLLEVAPVPFGPADAVQLTTRARQATTTATAFTLTDATGRVVRRGLLRLPAGPATQPLPGLAALPPGVYVLRLAVDGQPCRAKVVKWE